jgi:hypothetical protein
MAKKPEPTSTGAVKPSTAQGPSVAERLATPKVIVTKPLTGSSPQSEVSGRVIFTKLNWYLFFAGLGLMVLGFVLMKMETAEYGFGAMGLTVGPIILTLAFVVEFFAIMYREKPQSSTGQQNPNS